MILKIFFLTLIAVVHSLPTRTIPRIKISEQNRNETKIEGRTGIIGGLFSLLGEASEASRLRFADSIYGRYDNRFRKNYLRIAPSVPDYDYDVGIDQSKLLRVLLRNYKNRNYRTGSDGGGNNKSGLLTMLIDELSKNSSQDDAVKRIKLLRQFLDEFGQRKTDGGL